MPKRPAWARLISILLVFAIALALRLRAVERLPIDYDEDDYLGAAQHYARALNERSLPGIINYSYNYEHPALSKLLYGMVIAPLPAAPQLPELSSSLPPASSLPQPHFRDARLTSAALGTLEALALAVLNPLAGLFLAIQTWQIKYTSQVMLEPLPALTSLLAVLFYVKSRSRWNRWALLSAVALGLTAASKYLYCVAGLAILGHWLWVTRPADGLRDRAAWRRWVWPVALWGLVSLAVFWAADPYLWANPLGRLEQSLFFHGTYAQSEHVRQAGYPLWQPLVWLMGPVPWHPGVFVVALDLYITLLAGLGLQGLWRKQPVFVVWLALALGFLLVWPTKWPQYILILTAPLSLAAAEGFRSRIWEPLARLAQRSTARSAKQAQTGISQLDRLTTQRIARREGRQAVAWLLPGLLVLAAIAIFPLLFQGAMALTDFSTFSIRDGLQGGVWRAVWQGLTGQEPSVPVDASGVIRGAQAVHFVGPGLILQFFLGVLPDTLAFELLWTGLSVLVQTLLGVSAALMLHRRGVRFSGLWRAVYILPWAIPEFVGALVWLRIFEPRFGWLAMAMNIPKDIPQPQWFTNPNLTFLILLVAATWYGFPFIMLAATAGLKLIPTEVYEAAAIDGATPWEQFRYVTWPMLLPLLAPAVIIRVIFAFNQFYLFITMRPPPALQTFATLSYYIFSPSGPYGGQFAVSAAMNIFTVVVLVVLIAWFNRWSKASEGVTYA